MKSEDTSWCRRPRRQAAALQWTGLEKQETDRRCVAQDSEEDTKAEYEEHIDGSEGGTQRKASRRNQAGKI